MRTKTQNLGLNVWSRDDKLNVAEWTENFTKLDAAVPAAEQAAKDAAKQYTDDAVGDVEAQVQLVSDAVNGATADVGSLNQRVTAAENKSVITQINDLAASSPSTSVNIVGGTGILVESVAETNEIKVTATGTALPGEHASTHLTNGSDPIPEATTSSSGLMSPLDKQAIADTTGMLDDIAAQLAETANGNALINGNFDVWQRAVNANMVGMQYVADRWQNVLISSVSDPSVITVNRMPSQGGDVPGSAYYMRFEITNPGTGIVSYARCNMMQAIENGVRKLAGAGRKVTLSFWARTNIPGKLIGVNLHQDYGTGGTPSTYENIYGRNFELTSEWRRYSHTFETNSLAGKTFGLNNNDVLTPQIWLMWGEDYKIRFGTPVPETFRSAGYVDIAQIQLNTGDKALSFQPRRIADEINACQRYFKKSIVNFVYSNVDKIYTALGGWGRPMRIPPTITFGQLRGTYGTEIDTTATLLQQDENGIKTILLGELPVLNQAISCEVSADAEY
ncbi:hypothetical protein [Paenibacillus vini]|uniref:Uncharacterized protein n=1 Tax=Paenibacillus vini TaxID=1476024 RepID=A0ABQ4MAT0_9BACL|nr:hypothetical protein [Paenibacillus vini]GIP53096.1 hypothetical protein J42TS3_21310 [Paenibacillus vini]